VLIARQWFWRPAITVGIGLGFLVCSKAIRSLHPGLLAEAPISFASGEPVTLRVEHRFRMIVEVHVRVDKLRPDESNVSSLKRPKMRVEVSGAKLTPRDYDQPGSFAADSVGFEYAWVVLKPGTPATVTVHPSQSSSEYDARHPKLVLHEFHPDWGGFYAISIFANWIGFGCILIGLGKLVGRASKLQRKRS
jgi:hypothetical protein